MKSVTHACVLCEWVTKQRHALRDAVKLRICGHHIEDEIPIIIVGACFGKCIGIRAAHPNLDSVLSVFALELVLDVVLHDGVSGRT